MIGPMTPREEEVAAYNNQQAQPGAQQADFAVQQAQEAVESALELFKLFGMQKQPKGPMDRVAQLKALREVVLQKKPTDGYDPKMQLFYIDKEIQRLSGK